ncbi:Ku protein [Frateuria soli]|uniref:non-homologous end joining protein Ku n=1 Tax=Frateuria soli TaxID=1542730 RepID=UPI001E650CA3|nr:Ku protein [Frateuria soli]UGB37510.1 Ku protein [Frateuria soli]
MARPIWTGTLSFGLLNVPIRLMTAERKVDLHFRMLDQRNNQPVRYERVNAESGEEVPWKDIVKAYEYSKGSYVVLEESDIRNAAAEAHETVEIDTFIDAGQLTPAYFEKPYFLVPGKKAEKGYVLLRETLKRTGKIGIARVVIRTREYLCAVMPEDEALMLILLRFPQELVDADEYALPDKAVSEYRISDRELDMAGELIESMSGKFEPENYKDEFRERLTAVIEQRLKSKGVTTTLEEEEPAHANATTNVVDFMALLKKSIEGKQRTPAKGKEGPEKAEKAEKKPAAKKAAKKAEPAAKKASRKSPAKKATGARKGRKAG